MHGEETSANKDTGIKIIDEKDSRGRSALMRAVQSSRVDMVNLNLTTDWLFVRACLGSTMNLCKQGMTLGLYMTTPSTCTAKELPA